jgi:hypothetical protein
MSVPRQRVDRACLPLRLWAPILGTLAPMAIAGCRCGKTVFGESPATQKTNLGINVTEGIDKTGVLLFHVYR